MGHNCEFYSHKKLPDALVRSIVDMIYPVVRSQGSLVKTTVAVIKWQKQYILVETDRGVDLYPNGILPHSDTNSFLFSNKYSTYHKNCVVGYLPAHNFHDPGICLQY